MESVQRAYENLVNKRFSIDDSLGDDFQVDQPPAFFGVRVSAKASFALEEQS